MTLLVWSQDIDCCHLVTWFKLYFIFFRLHAQNNRVINANEPINNIQNGIESPWALFFFGLLIRLRMKPHITMSLKTICYLEELIRLEFKKLLEAR